MSLQFSVRVPRLVVVVLLLLHLTTYSVASVSPSYLSKATNRRQLIHQPFLPSTVSAFSFPSLGNLAPTFLQITSATAAYFGLVAYFDQPRGNLNVDPSDLLVQKSQVEGAGLGLFVAKTLPAGTILGTYPGVVRPLEKNLQKLKNYPQCETYIWRFTDNKRVIDPTDKKGILEDECFGGSAETPGSEFFMEKVLRWTVPTILARINEPPLGKDCNVFSEEDLEKRSVVFSLSRDVVKGEELFMDYGLSYDRSNYSKPS